MSAMRRSYSSMLRTTMSPAPFRVMKTGSRVLRQKSEISLALLRRSDIGRMLGIRTTSLRKC